MKIKFILVAFLLAGIAGQAFAQDAKPRDAKPQDAKLTIESFSWLSGCWTNTGKSAETTLEQWLKPAGGMMFGVGRTIKDGKVVNYEFTRIHQDAEGNFFFTAKLPKQDEVSFKLIKSSGGDSSLKIPRTIFRSA